MAGVKVYAVLAVVSWWTSIGASLAQVAVGPDTLLPLGVAVACLAVAVGAAVKVTRWVDRVENRLKKLENGE